MEYFLGAIHWLDALTPPLEQHLQKLAETVKAMLKIEKADDGVAVRQAPKISNRKAVSETMAPLTRAADTAQQDGAPTGLLPRWVVPTTVASALLVLLAGAFLIYQTGAFTPRRTNGTETEPQARPATLRGAAELRGFSIGAAAALVPLRNEPVYSQVLAREYNITSPEGEMRFKRLHPTRTEFNFAETDPIINFSSSHNIKYEAIL